MSVLYWDWSGPELSAKYGLESRRVIDGWLPELGTDETCGWRRIWLSWRKPGETAAPAKPSPRSPHPI